MLHLVSCGGLVDIRGICMIHIFIISLEKSESPGQISYTLASKVDNFTGGYFLANMEERVEKTH